MDNWVRLPANRDDKLTLKPGIDFTDPDQPSPYGKEQCLYRFPFVYKNREKEDVEPNSVDLSGDELRDGTNRIFSDAFRLRKSDGYPFSED